MNNIFYQDDAFEDEAYDGKDEAFYRRMTYERDPRRMTNPNPNRREGFSFPNHDRRRSESSPNEYQMKIEIPSFSGNFDIILLGLGLRSGEIFRHGLCLRGEACQVCSIQAQGRICRLVGSTISHTETPR